MFRAGLCFAGISLLVAIPLVSDTRFQLTIDNIMRGPNLYGWAPQEVRWSPDGAHVYFSWKQWNDPLEKDRDTYVVNRDASGLRKLSDEEKKDAPPPNNTGDRTDRKSVV